MSDESGLSASDGPDLTASDVSDREPGGGRALVEIDLDGFAHGGAAVGRLPDGRACFVDYGIPGERVRVEITETRKRWARASVVEVIRASPDRVAPPCPLFGPGKCGGCSTQHIAVERQAQLLGSVIVDQLRRIGHIEVPGGTVQVVSPHGGDGLGYRSRARFAVTRQGRLAFRRARSNRLIEVTDCPLLTTSAHAAMRDATAGWRNVAECTLQADEHGGAALAITRSPGASEAPVVPSSLPWTMDKRPQGRGRRRRERPPARRDGPERSAAKVHHVVAGHTYQVSATSFFQASIPAAEAMVDLVRTMTEARGGQRVVDLFAGVGLFSVPLAADGATVTAIEADRVACDDATTNAAGHDVTVLRADLRNPPRLADAVDAVVLDPPRTGAGPDLIAWITKLAPARITYVSCDPATFARDARLLADRGYALRRVAGVDQFTHSGRVELVAAFSP